MNSNTSICIQYFNNDKEIPFSMNHVEFVPRIGEGVDIDGEVWLVTAILHTEVHGMHVVRASVWKSSTQ